MYKNSDVNKDLRPKAIASQGLELELSRPRVKDLGLKAKAKDSR